MPELGIGVKKVLSDTFAVLGTFVYGNKVCLLTRSRDDPTHSFHLSQSDDGFNFESSPQEGHIRLNNELLDLKKIGDLKISKVGQDLIAVFVHRDRTKKIYFAKLVSLLDWAVIEPPNGLTSSGLITKSKTDPVEYFFYGGQGEIKVAPSDDLTNWKTNDSPIITPRANKFDSGSVSIQTVLPLAEGNLLLYQSQVANRYRVGAAVFDHNDPDVMLWRSDEALWQSIPEWTPTNTAFIGAVEYLGKIFTYWQVKGQGIFTVVYLHLNHDLAIQSKNISLFLSRPKTNPIISPKAENPWEAFNTFNPAAIYENNQVHILYRAQGHDYSSVVGYATSTDGITINQRLDRPCYTPKERFEATGTPSSLTPGFMSGGGYGGCEDPRLTKIGDRIYMTYVAFNGNSEPRIALTSISVTDFLNHRWLWEKPVLISPPGIIDKSAVIFPEKIGNKFVILHRVFPDILMDFVDSLEFDGSAWLKGEFQIKIRKDHWDSRKIGAGAPPIKTKDGWLLIYYAVDERDSGRYKIGAMLLDLDDPRTILHRTNNPILEPTERYENEGFKAGVAYPCGAVVIGPTLFVYYGAADTFVCVATANLDDFLAELKFANLAKLEPAYIRPIN